MCGESSYQPTITIQLNNQQVTIKGPVQLQSISITLDSRGTSHQQHGTHLSHPLQHQHGTHNHCHSKGALMRHQEDHSHGQTQEAEMAAVGVQDGNHHHHLHHHLGDRLANVTTVKLQ